MPTQAELEFVDESGRFFARIYRTPPAVGRVAGWLLVSEALAPTAADVARDLQMSRSGVGEAIKTLEQWRFVKRFRRPGERADRVWITADFDLQLEDPSSYQAIEELAVLGLDMLDGASLERRGRLLELRAFNTFVADRMPQLAADWRAHRDALRTAGALPPQTGAPRGEPAATPSDAGTSSA